MYQVNQCMYVYISYASILGKQTRLIDFRLGRGGNTTTTVAPVYTKLPAYTVGTLVLRMQVSYIATSGGPVEAAIVGMHALTGRYAFFSLIFH